MCRAVVILVEATSWFLRKGLLLGPGPRQLFQTAGQIDLVPVSSSISHMVSE